MLFMMHPTSLLFLLVLFGVSDAHFPRPCTDLRSRKARICCPDYEGSLCGSELGRGDCVKFTSKHNIWPPPLYTYYCKCKGNFDTYDCSRCKPGYKGENCTERQHYVRKEITTLTKEEKQRLGKTLQKAKNTNSERYMILTREFNETDLTFENATVYNLFVWMHYFAGRAAAYGGRNGAHNGPAFPFWHRNYLLFMEREIRDLTGDDTFFIPYWDWSRASDCNICTCDLMGESNEDGTISSDSVFSKWETVCTYDDEMHPYNGTICVKPPDGVKPKPILRFPGGHKFNCTGLPGIAEVEATLSPDDYDTPPYDRCSKNSFRNRLEGFDKTVNEKDNCGAMHNQVHNYVGGEGEEDGKYGTMSLVPTAANDPMFMLHHAMVDRLLEKWLETHRDMKYPVSDDIHYIQRGDNYMRPFFPPVRNDFLVGFTAEDLGYSYD